MTRIKLNRLLDGGAISKDPAGTPAGRFPNGIAVSADNSRLVVAEMDGECLAEYDIEPDGSLNFRRRFGSMKNPDGICLDREGAEIELMVADIAMPGMSGVELAHAARLGRPDLPILFVTGYADTEVLEAAAGDGIVRKPFVEKDLAAKLRSALKVD